MWLQTIFLASIPNNTPFILLKQFVRIRPGSLLESLYSQHGKNGNDRCLLCNQPFRSHLACWWFNELYTPFDLYIERINRHSSQRSTEDSNKFKLNGNGSALNQGPFLFHPTYVKDLDQSKKTNSKRKSSNDLKPVDKYKVGAVQYSVPCVTSHSSKSAVNSMLHLVRAIVLEELNMMIDLQQRENLLKEWKEMCRL